MLKKLSASGMTVISSMHAPTHAYRYADKVVALKQGRVCACVRPEEVITEENIEQIYGVRARVLPEYRAVVLDVTR